MRAVFCESRVRHRLSHSSYNNRQAPQTRSKARKALFSARMCEKSPLGLKNPFLGNTKKKK